jgi:transcription elongation factor Elf1
MIVTEAFWVPHCDDHSCDLGTFDYTCPACDIDISSCHLWWNHEDPVFSFKCRRCGAKLKTVYDEGDTYVELG